jgi:hypothetical protein
MSAHVKRFFTVTNRKDFITDMASAAALACVGDAACQVLVEGRRVEFDSPEMEAAGAYIDSGEKEHAAFDVRRTVSMTVFSGPYAGFLHCLYKQYTPVVLGIGKRLSQQAMPRLKRTLSNTKTTGHKFAWAWVDNAHCTLIYTPAYFIW